MAQPYVGEIRMFAGNFAPAGWMFCEGQLLPISEYETLFNLIGTTYGGDGQSTFALPFLASADIASQRDPTNNVLAQLNNAELYSPIPGTSTLSPSSMGAIGGSQPHNNFQPYLCVDFIISLFGIFPSQT